MRRVALDRAGDQVAADDAARLAVDDDEVEHLAVGEATLTVPRSTCRIID